MFLNKLKLFIIRNIYYFHTRGNQELRMWKVDDNRLSTFTNICEKISKENSYLNKAQILREFFCKGSNKKEFQGDILLWTRMLIPGDCQRVYNLQNKQMVKLFSRIFNCDANEMHLDLEQEGDVSETLRKFFITSTKLIPQEDSVLYLQEVEEFLKNLEHRTKEDEQTELLTQICKKTTPADLKTIIRIIKQDLRMNAKASHILAAFGDMAYSSYQTSRDLAEVVKKFSLKSTKQVFELKQAKTVKGKMSKIIDVQVMTPIAPMLANACNSIEEAFKKSPSGLFSEIKYDGERVQIHKQGTEFKFFSRNLKPVMDHKVRRFKEFIPKAFPGAGDMILDSEIILVDTVTGELLPFGSLGAHKKKEFPNAEVCLFVFDCILFQGKDLRNLSFRERRKILEDNITSIKSYVQLSESYFLKTKKELSLMTAKVLKANLEGVVLKDPLGTYQPGKRGWLKVKKDYLFGGRMADTADLVVLGASFGSGKKGGVLSKFLMGTFDHRDCLWKTVTKVHSGLDDETQMKVHNNLMKLIERSDGKQVPSWLLCNKVLIPDFIAKDPKAMPVWEITGAEFTKSGEHTASGISIRFPRVTRFREDKSADEANDLELLEKMFDASKNNVNVDLLIKGCSGDDADCNEDNLKINSKLVLQKTPAKATISDNKISPGSSSRRRQMGNLNENENLSHKNKKVKTASFENYDKKTSEKQSTLQISFQNCKNLKTDPIEQVTTERESYLFKNMVAYFENVNGTYEIIKKFKANSGAVTKDSIKADVIFYESYDVKVDLSDCRTKYRKTSHHVSKEWMLECLKQKKLLDYGLYAIVIK